MQGGSRPNDFNTEFRPDPSSLVCNYFEIIIMGRGNIWRTLYPGYLFPLWSPAIRGGIRLPFSLPRACSFRGLAWKPSSDPCRRRPPLRRKCTRLSKGNSRALQSCKKPGGAPRPCCRALSSLSLSPPHPGLADFSAHGQPCKRGAFLLALKFPDVLREPSQKKAPAG